MFLTIGRLFVSPLFLVFYLFHESFGVSFKILPYILLGLILLSEISDFFDGLIARRYNAVTELGKVLDPMADSLTQTTILFAFTQGIVQLPLVLIVLFLYRDLVISTLRTLCAMKGYTLAARMSGKIKAFLQGMSILSIVALMIPYSLNWISLATLRVISFDIICVTAAYTLFSGIEYIWVNRSYIKQAWVH
ncbi:MAG: CDP-alcohol phosphatidyltransferase family protein [Simkaniaceae bacterium]|nr:CDP-alcohol phosphatidyltransferase family protein [Simkaniaceae bacterium]